MTETEADIDEEAEQHIESEEMVANYTRLQMNRIETG